MDTDSSVRQLTVCWRDPGSGRAHADRTAGLEHLEAVRSGAVPGPPVMALVGARFADLGTGRAVVRMDLDERHRNIAGSVHGGLIATLLDLALGAAVHTTLLPGQGYTTLELTSQFVRAAPDRGALHCTAEVTHRGRRTATATASVRDDEARNCAFGTTTCLVLGRPAADPDDRREQFTDAVAGRAVEPGSAADRREMK